MSRDGFGVVTGYTWYFDSYVRLCKDRSLLFRARISYIEMFSPYDMVLENRWHGMLLYRGELRSYQVHYAYVAADQTGVKRRRRGEI